MQKYLLSWSLIINENNNLKLTTNALKESAIKGKNEVVKETLSNFINLCFNYFQFSAKNKSMCPNL